MSVVIFILTRLDTLMFSAPCLTDEIWFFQCPSEFFGNVVDTGLFKLRCFFEVDKQTVSGFHNIVVMFRPEPGVFFQGVGSRKYNLILIFHKPNGLRQKPAGCQWHIKYSACRHRADH